MVIKNQQNQTILKKKDWDFGSTLCGLQDCSLILKTFKFYRIKNVYFFSKFVELIVG